MRAILIDPSLQSVTEIEMPDFRHQTVANEVFLGGDGYIQRLDIGGGLIALIDADGGRSPRPAIFQLAPSPGLDDPSDPTYAGRMLIAGEGEQGEPVPCPRWITIDLIARSVTWTGNRGMIQNGHYRIPRKGII